MFSLFSPFLTIFGYLWLIYDPIFDHFLGVNSSDVGSNVRQKHVKTLRDFFALFSPFSPFILPFLFVNLIDVLCVLPCSFGTAIFFHFFNLWGIYPDPLLVAPFGGTFWGLPRARVGARARARGRARARCLALLVYIVFNMTQIVAYLGFIPLHWGVPPFGWGLVVSKKG